MVEGEVVEPAIADQASEMMKKESGEINQAKGVAAAPARVQPVHRDAEQNASQNSFRNVQLSQSAKNRGLLAGQTRQEGHRNVLTRIQNVNNQMQLTLYPETLFTEEAIRRALIEPIGNDSLRVTIGNQTILYRIPQQLQQQTPAR